MLLQKELWNDIIFFYFGKDGEVFSMLMLIIKEVLKHLSLAFRELDL